MPVVSFTAPPVKKSKTAPLHEHYVTPLSFLAAAVEESTKFLGSAGGVGGAFGLQGEAYVRQCYAEILEKIQETWVQSANEGFKSMLAVNIAVIYAPKEAKTSIGLNVADSMHCMVWLDGKLSIDGDYADVRKHLQEVIPKLKLIVMDDCSMPFSLVHFTGAVIVAASPSLYVKNLQDAIFFHRYLTMPAVEEKEAIDMAETVGVPEDTVKNNLLYMNGITRYLFSANAAKAKVMDAVDSVSASSITRMVSMQSSNKREESFAVHSLVLWKVTNGDYFAKPGFELVSRYAEQLVAKKLARETMEDLKNARRSMAPLSGAEGYAGALFEAYAIRTLQEGGAFMMRRLDGTNETKTISIPRLTLPPVVVETNNLTAALVRYDEVRVPDGSGIFSPRLLWPTTTNFPTFDCFYFHTDGKVFPLQMTIAVIRDLKNSGADNAKKYFDKMYGKGKPAKYPAIFVVPKETAPSYTVQKFRGNVDKKAANLGLHYEQWVAGI